MTARVDAHHHLWQLSVRDQGWVIGEAMAPLRRDFVLADLEAAMRGNAVAHTVVVQSVADIGETLELLELAATSSLVSGVVGWVDLEASDVGDRLDALREATGGEHLVGVRSLVQDEPDPAWLLRPRVLAGLRQIADRGLVYDLLIKPQQLAAATAAVQQQPACRFVVDHAAKPPIGSRDMEPWAGELAQLAALANVSCKLSGLVTEADWATWSVDDLRPYADHVLSCFGPERVMFGTDWPVCTLAASYDTVVRSTEELLEDLAPDERAAVFGGTATRIYDLRHQREPQPGGAPT